MDSNTLRVEAKVCKSATKNLRIQKYSDTCERAAFPFYSKAPFVAVGL